MTGLPRLPGPLLCLETSCDDTSAAIVQGRAVLSSIVSSQNELHAQFGGVVPEVASRRHTELVNDVVAEAMTRRRRGLGRPRRRRHHARPGPHRRIAGRSGGGQSHRLSPPLAADPREPHPGAHRRQLRARRGGPVRLSRGQRRAHPAGRGRRGRRATASRRGPWTTPPARPSTRARACSGWATPAARSWTFWPPAATRASCASRGPCPAAATSASAASRRPCSTTCAAAHEAEVEAHRADIAASYQAAIVSQLVEKTLACAAGEGLRRRRHRRRRGRQLGSAHGAHRALRG